jgi:hypothetical protein
MVYLCAGAAVPLGVLAAAAAGIFFFVFERARTGEASGAPPIV